MTNAPRPIQPPRHAPYRALLSLFLLALTAAGPSPEAAKPDPRALAFEAGFIQENDAAMTTMMAGMDVKPSGDVDRDFAAMMIPHHQGAIDMAIAELRHGHNEQLRRIAQEIIVDQQQEIAAMRLALGQTLPPPAPAPTQGTTGGMPDMHTMHHDVTTQQEPQK